MAKLFQKTPKQNNALSTIRKKVVLRAVIAVQTIVITIALIFGMSAAWYTNVLQTSGLQFEAEAWGFSGQVTVSEEAIQASPGDNGLIGLTVTNTADTMVDVSVYVDKVQMVEEMQQRLYFYVDTADTRNGETMERVYINTTDTYAYTILGGSALVLTEERVNDAPLKWQWVYDMLGYYFVGTVGVTQQTTQETVEDGTTQDVVKLVYTANAEEYLRPVEYDLDSATFDENGMLLTVDGTTTVEQFLAQFSKTDGYAGDITAATMKNVSLEDNQVVDAEETDVIPGFYQVDVDENGYGIWVYLCNWTDIQNATAYDSALGKAAAEADEGDELPVYKARLTIVGQATQSEYTAVTTIDQLTTALNSGGIVQLQNDLTLAEPIKVTSSADTMLDLNGHIITGPADDVLMKLSDAADVTILNGSIVAQNAGKDVITVSGSSLTLNGVKISGEGDDAIDISDSAGTVNSSIRLMDCEIDVDGCAVYVRGDGSAEDGATRIVIENCTLTSGYITIMGNGSAAYWGTDIQVYNSTLVGEYATVYQPQGDSIIRLAKTTASALTGVVVKGGDLEIVDSTITATGEKNEAKLEKSGFTDTGDAVYVDCSYETAINVTISGEETALSSTNGNLIQVFVPKDYKNLATVTTTYEVVLTEGGD